MATETAIVTRSVSKCFRVRPRTQQISTTKRMGLTALAAGRRVLGRPTALDREIWALRDVSFEVRRGEMLGVLGRNGAGKSTLLAVLAGVTSPTLGHAELHGRVSSLLGIGTGFHPELTGRDNVLLNGVVLGMTRAEVARKFDDIVEFAGIGEFVDLPVRLYSTGMAARLMFAVAAHVEPDILLIDEVLGVGDFEFRERCHQAIDRMVGSGLTGVLVTHDLISVRRLCNQALVLERGEAVFFGSVDEAVDRYTQSPGGGEIVHSERRDLRIVDVAVKGADGDPRVISARPLAIRVQLETDYTRPGRNVILQVLVTDPRGRPLTFLSTRIGEDPLRDAEIADGASLVCVLDGLPLRAGEYLLTLKLWEGGEVIEELRDVAFEIVTGDSLSGPRTTDQSPPLVVPHRWLLEEPARPFSAAGYR